MWRPSRNFHKQLFLAAGRGPPVVARCPVGGRASQVLAQALPANVPRTYAALSELGKVAISTLHHRDNGRRSREALAQSQQYLYPDEEKAERALRVAKEQHDRFQRLLTGESNAISELNKGQKAARLGIEKIVKV